MLWHPAVPLTSSPTTLFAHLASALLSSLLIFRSSQVHPFSAGSALADTVRNALLTDIPSLLQVTFQSLHPYPTLFWSAPTAPQQEIIYYCLWSLFAGMGARTLLVYPLLHLSPRFSRIAVEWMISHYPGYLRTWLDSHTWWSQDRHFNITSDFLKSMWLF